MSSFFSETSVNNSDLGGGQRALCAVEMPPPCTCELRDWPHISTFSVSWLVGRDHEEERYVLFMEKAARTSAQELGRAPSLV